MTNKSNIFVSFIIPAFNEEDSIDLTLASIFSGDLGFPYEVIVVDHESKDRTAELAKSRGCKVVLAKGGTIARVRNLGVQHSKGEVLVFLDADVSLTSQWFEVFASSVGRLKGQPMMITGSHCNAPKDGNWIERYWFNNYAHEVDANNLGTGHMILKKSLFEAVNGFDEQLETGEDYNFCMKVLYAGGEVVNNSSLYVIHRGYPKTIKEFILREAWHGRGDVASVSNFIKSKVAIAAFMFIWFHLWGLYLLIYPLGSISSIVLPFIGVVALIVVSSWKKFKHCSVAIVIINSLIYYLYFAGRSLSIFKALLRT